MSQEYEEAMMLVIPAARAAVSQILKKDHGMTQAEIARRLDTTQAAISKYLNKRYSAKIKKMKLVLEEEGVAKEIAKLVVSGAKIDEISDSMDKIAYKRRILSKAIDALKSPTK